MIWRAVNTGVQVRKWEALMNMNLLKMFLVLKVGRDFRFSNVIMATFSVFRIPKGFV